MKSNGEGDQGDRGRAAEGHSTGSVRETQVADDPEPRAAVVSFLAAGAPISMPGLTDRASNLADFMPGLPASAPDGLISLGTRQHSSAASPVSLTNGTGSDAAAPFSNKAPPVSSSGSAADEAGFTMPAMELEAESLPPEMGGAPGVGASDPSQDAAAYADWADLVGRIHSGETDGMEELYTLFSKGVRFYLCRQLGPQELDDKVHDTFVVVVQAIRRGELRDPQRLMGFVRTIVRRQVAAHIDRVVHIRREQIDMESTVRIADPHGNSEETAIFRQRTALIGRVLSELSERDREILTRFYLREQSQDQICAEMVLTETQFRLLKSRAKARFGEIGKKKIAHKAFGAVMVRTSAGLSH